MNKAIERVQSWLNQHSRCKQWIWFLILWTGGITTVAAMTYPIQWIIKG